MFRMILRFPTLDCLKLAITSATLPAEIVAAPLRADFEDSGAISIEPSVPLPQAVRAGLLQLGAEIPWVVLGQPKEPLSCWPQGFPLVADPAAAELSSRTAVLFALDEPQLLPDLVGEILRLGNDRQSFCHVKQGDRTRALLRVVGPPYYSLLRAMDNGITMAATVHAYVERRPRVWIELGHSHPLADRLEPPPGQLLLLSPPRNWEFVDECPMQDVYQVLDCCLPHAESAWSAAELVARLPVSLRLVPGSNDAAEMWVLGGDASAQLDALVQGADDQLLARLAFAVGQRDGQRTIILRTRPSKQSPPVMVVDGLALQPCLKLPNLFVPCGYRLHPPLRRSTLAQVLASDTSRITWLVPEADGRFAPQSLPDAAFRPLSDYVDYVLDREHESLEAWVAAHRFDFESFVCREDRAVRGEKPPPEKPVASKLPSRPASRPVASGQTQESEEEPIVFTPVEPDGEPAAMQPAAPTDRERLQRRLFEIEQQFLALQSPLDEPDRAALWQEMAQANAALGHHVDAAHCCAAAVWDDDSRLAAILPAWEKVAKDGAVEPLDELQFARLMAVKDLAPERAGAVANFLIWAVASPHSPLSSLFRQRQGPLARFLERNEAVLPARIAWLAWCAMNHLNGDVLALARARDLALERL